MSVPIGDQHRLIIDALQKIYTEKTLKKRRGLISSDELHKKLNLEDVHFLAILCSRVVNMHGASVGTVNLYKLFEAYFLNPEKRDEINKLL